MESALLNVRLASRDMKNLPKVFYYQRQALALFERLGKEYGDTKTAENLATGKVNIGDLPYPEWKRELTIQSEIIGSAGKDILAFTYAMALLNYNVSQIAFIGNRFAEAGEIEKAKAVWKSAAHIEKHTFINQRKKAELFESMANGKINAGLFEDAKKDAVSSQNALVMAQVAYRLAKTGRHADADALIDDAFTQIQQKTRAHIKGMLTAAVIREAKLIRDHPVAREIIQTLMKEPNKRTLGRLQVECLSAIAFYHAKIGQSKTATEYFDLALDAAAKEEKLSRKFLLLLNLSRIMFDAGRKKDAANVLSEVRRLAMGLPSTPSRDRDRAFGQIAEMAARFEDEPGAMALCMKIDDYDLRRNTYFLVYKQTGSLAPLEKSLVLAKEEENPLKIADALCDITGWYISIKKKERALEYWKQGINYFADAVGAPMPAHFIRGEGDSIEMLRLSSMLKTLVDLDKIDEDFHQKAFDLVWPVALHIAGREDIEKKAKVLALVTQYAPTEYQVLSEHQSLLREWLYEQRHFFVQLYRSTKI